MSNNNPRTKAEAKKKAEQGLLVFSIGFAVTFFSIVTASVSGRYVIAWGAMIFGGIRAFKYYSMINDLPEKASRRPVIDNEIEENETVCLY